MQKPDPADQSKGGRRPPVSSGLIGALNMFILGLLWVLLGFWKLLFILILALVGYYLGFRYFYDREAIRKLIDRILPPGMFR